MLASDWLWRLWRTLKKYCWQVIQLSTAGLSSLQVYEHRNLLAPIMLVRIHCPISSVSPHTYPHPCSLPPSGDFTPVCSATHLRRRVMCWMLKHITQEGFLPEKEPLYKILQHVIVWRVDRDQLPASHQLHPSLPTTGRGGENKMKKLRGQEKDKETTHPLLSQAKQNSLGK